MRVYLRTTFTNIFLTSLKQGVILLPPSLQTPQRPTQIRVINFLLKYFSLSLKPISFIKSSMSFLVASFASFNHAVKFSIINLLNS